MRLIKGKAKFCHGQVRKPFTFQSILEKKSCKVHQEFWVNFYVVDEEILDLVPCC